MTVSRIAPARTVPAPDVEASPAVPAQPGRPQHDEVASVRRAVEALRRALREGTVHHHGDSGVPARRRGPGVEVVRAWAGGHGVEEQRRVCGDCAATPVGP